MREEDHVKAIRRLLLFIVIPLVLYLLHLMAIIFVPLAFALFASLLFMPMVRWFKKNNIPDFVGLIVVVVIILGSLFLAYELVNLAVNQMSSASDSFYTQLINKINSLIKPVLELVGIQPQEGQTHIETLAKNENISSGLFGGVSQTFNFTRRFIVMLLMTIFFIILLLAGSLNMQRVMHKVIFKKQFTSIRTFLEIERNIKTFIWVKTFMSLGTGICYGVAAWSFGVKFPLFWGLFAFVANYIQMVGSIISIVALGIFGLVTLEMGSILVFFILIITAIQGLFGGVLEPIMMGKSFKINTITILVMLSIWGFIWGIPGLILSIPITALAKKVFEKFEDTKIYSELMS